MTVESRVFAGTTMKVSELVTAHKAYGWNPDELTYQFPYLTLGQIHSALAYYWDHQKSVDDEIERALALLNKLRRETPDPPIVTKLRDHKSG